VHSLNHICVIVGVIVYWLLRGCQYDLGQELREIEPLDFFRRPEGAVGLATLLAIAGIVSGVVHHFK
jgi:hypothetical protein